MSDYKFDGKELRKRGSKVASVDGKYIRDAHGARIGEVEGKYIRDAHGTRIGEFDGQTVRDSHGSRTSTIRDVQKDIEGLAGIALVALWILCVREK